MTWTCLFLIGALYGEKHSYDLWNFVDMKELAKTKKGEVDDEGDFIRTVEENFTLYCQSLIPWVNRLRKVVFPDGRRQRKENQEL
jgi:hypothetical protein